ncbi:hypothetical protein P43SY_008936 [Pythium insidiosum]|uniref:Chromo domain-containing protein n=1 Tax=Pythium insidiosum TaxID=114742 RepID=A0AAD5M8H7_PYTIN|nr:hypothetical protein P43SY_008936 [Pythium insidiosum]
MHPRVVGHPTVPQYVLTSIGAPKLDRVAHENLTKWMDLRFEYEEAVRAQCKNTGGDPNSLMVSLRNSFDEAYLDTLCEIEWRMSKENLTDDFMWQWIKSEVETFKNQTMPDIEGLFQKELKFGTGSNDVKSQGLFQKELKFGTGSNDVKSQVLDYFHSCNTIIRTNGLASLFNGNDEKKCKILVKCLPEKLKKPVKNEIDFGKDGNPKRDVPALYQLILRMALEQAKEDQVLRQAKRQREGDGDSPGAKRQRNGGKGGGKTDNGGPSWDGVLHSDGCYGCGGNHSLMNCTKLSKNAKSKLELLAAPSNEDDDDTKDDPPVAGARDDEKIRKAIEDMVQRAIEEGFPVARIERLRTVISMYDIWRVKLGDDPPARVEPLKVRLKKNAVPYKSKARKYSPELQRFLEDFNEQLVNLGWVYENPNSRWACPALPVKKAGGEYRQTTDYKPTNLQVEPLAGLMPNLDVDLERVMGCVCFGLFDFIKGYWQLPLDEESQEILSYMTHRKIYTPRRVPQGCSDAALYFQSTMERCFASLLYEHLLVWIDDLLLYAKDVDTYLDKLQELFGLVDRFGFKLSVTRPTTKSSVYRKEVKWCGRIINGDGVRHDPVRIEALVNLPVPSNAGELQQFICSTNWMRNSIIDYARLVRPLQDKLDAVLATAKKRTKRVATKIPITLSREEQDAFGQVKRSLADAATLAFPKPDAETCLLTDASDVGWSVIVTQVAEWNADLPVSEQQHELLICMGGSFTGAQRNWSVIEKEAYPIVTACDKLSYLLMRPKGFKMFCDHRNLIHVFAPASEMKKHFYADSSFEVTEEVREHIAGQGTVMTVDKLLEHRWHKGKKNFELLVAWKGLEPIENSWETLASLNKDIPVMVKTYTSASKDQALQRRVEQLA